MNPGAAVTLDGSGSSDPNGDALTYGWVQTGGEAVSFTPDLTITTFTAPVERRPTYLRADRHRPGGAVRHCQHGRHREQPGARRPMPGRTSRSDPGAAVTLDGSASSDPNGDALTYGWVQTGGEAVSFTPDLATTTFTAPDSAGPLTFELTVTDPAGLSDSRRTVVTVSDLAPTADAGPDQQVDPAPRSRWTAAAAATRTATP